MGNITKKHRDDTAYMEQIKKLKMFVCAVMSKHKTLEQQRDGSNVARANTLQSKESIDDY